jgi:hypothetical protein
MHGVLLLCPKSARLYYSHAWTAGFGISSPDQASSARCSHWLIPRCPQSTSVLQPDIDVMNLSALVYAVHVNACASLQAPPFSFSSLVPRSSLLAPRSSLLAPRSSLFL